MALINDPRRAQSRFLCTPASEDAAPFRLTNQEYIARFPAGDDALATGHCNKSCNAAPPASLGRMQRTSINVRHSFSERAASDSDEYANFEN